MNSLIDLENRIRGLENYLFDNSNRLGKMEESLEEMKKDKEIEGFSGLNLYQKLVQVRKSCPYIQKTADGYKFKYASEGQILAAIREEMDHQNVFLEIEQISLEQIECSIIADKKVIMIPGLRATYDFIWTNADNPSEQIKKKMIVQDTEQSIKTCGGLLTYANKYFLYKFFSVPTDKLDPDAFENSMEKIVATLEPIKTQTPVFELPLTDAQKAQLDMIAEVLPTTALYILDKYGISSLYDIKSSNYDHVIGVFETARKKKEAHGKN